MRGAKVPRARATAALLPCARRPGFPSLRFAVVGESPRPAPPRQRKEVAIEIKWQALPQLRRCPRPALRSGSGLAARARSAPAPAVTSHASSLSEKAPSRTYPSRTPPWPAALHNRRLCKLGPGQEPPVVAYGGPVRPL